MNYNTVLENLIQDKSKLTFKCVKKKNNNKIKIISYPHTFTRACPHTDIIIVLTEGSVGFTTQNTGQNVTCFICERISDKHGGSVFVLFSLELNSSLTRDQLSPPPSRSCSSSLLYIFVNSSPSDSSQQGQKRANYDTFPRSLHASREARLEILFFFLKVLIQVNCGFSYC